MVIIIVFFKFSVLKSDTKPSKQTIKKKYMPTVECQVKTEIYTNLNIKTIIILTKIWLNSNKNKSLCRNKLNPQLKKMYLENRK